ncbi:serine hydrolase, partial [Pseudomonas ogarae]|uniref:serine hydrolase n=1 Tax=Pseudomonas ogarae (strain DSM 112162 / CECT 30235 / F113) TaxID=1114970 RepID=UPI0019510693
IAASPDTLWTYNGGGTDLLGNIIEQVSGKPLEAFARETLFQPLGITDLEWKTYPKNGKVAAAAGLRLRPRDAAKI